MTASIRVSPAFLPCDRCGGIPLVKTCTCRAGDSAKLAAEVRDRHLQSLHHAAAWSDPDDLPEAPHPLRWVAGTLWSAVHLIGGDGRSLCRKVAVGLGSRPAQAGARWCRLCAHSAGVDE